MRTVGTLVALTACLACDASPEPGAGGVATFQAFSLTGDSLFTPPLRDSLRSAREGDLAAARDAWQRDTADVEAIVWLGRRTAYLGRYTEAVDIYDAGLRRHPDEPRLLRHRGHRYLTLRRLDAAIDDLARAASLTAGRPDEVEQDGLPNARNEPRSTLQTNIWYHLALAHYLRGEFAQAAIGFARCRELAGNDDMRVAAAYWEYLASRRAGSHDAAADVLGTITAEMDVIENHTYHRLLGLYAGRVPLDSVLPGGMGSVDDATAAYGVAAWHLVEGRGAEAGAMLDRIVAAPDQWPAFGYVAAEADLARSR
jgi:tetratricopeptide (TPR) repeat protein